MKYAILAVRMLLGLAFVVFGSNYFLHFLAMPMPELTPAAKSFMDAVVPSGYMNAVKCFEITGGVLVLTGLFVPLGLTLLTPVLVNIVFYDLFLMGKPGLGEALLAMAIFLIWCYRANFAAVFTMFAKPSGCCGK